MDNKERVVAIVDSLEPELERLALDIHDNPELGMQEFKACAWQKDILTKYGFEVEENFCGLPTAYKAVYNKGKSGPVIAFLSEYDALKDLGHGCGHNLIAMVACGCGIACREFADEYDAEIRVIGTPAEETMGSKVMMSKRGAFKDCDVVLMGHPSFSNADSTNSNACQGFKIEFFGKSAHAGATPHEGINALDAMINFFTLVNAMRQQVKPDVRLHGIITNGGQAHNAIPEYTAAEYDVRCNRVADIKELTERLRHCVEAAALGTGCTWKMEPQGDVFKDMHSNHVLNNLVADHYEEFATAPILRTNCAVLPGSTDMGNVSYEAPSIQPFFKIGDCFSLFSGGHTPEMVEAAGSDYGVNGGLNFIKGMTLAAIDIMSDPHILADIREEFSHINDQEASIF
ncbi:MAG: M20 family metallopeptidase [Anaerovoracaceae bacterium]